MTDFDFSNLDAFEVNAQSRAEFALRWLGPMDESGERPTLIVAPATMSNPAYQNAVIKAGDRYRSRMQAATEAEDSMELVAVNREIDRLVFPTTIIKDWRHVAGADGKPVPFSAAAAKAFIDKLPNWIFDRLRGFCGSDATFAGKKIDAEAVAGN